MYTDSTEGLNTSAKKFTTYTIMLAAFGAFVFFIFFLPGRLLYSVREYFYFLIFPAISILMGVSVKSFVSTYFIGRWSGLVASFILYLANGISAVLFFTFASNDMKYLTSIVWVALLAVSIIVCKASKFFYTGIYEGCTIKAFSYVMMGLSIKSMFGGFWKDGYSVDEFWRSFSNLVLISFIVLAILQMSTLVELFYNEKARRISMWLKSNHIMKYILIFIMAFVISLMRRDNLGSGLAGWIFLFMILLVVFIIFAAMLWGSVKYSPEEKLAKHMQDMSFDKSKDLENITKYIDDYVNYGKKSKLVSYLTFLGYKTGIPFNAVSNIIAPLVEYSDPEIPGMLTSEQYKAIEERNRQNRSKVIEKITSNLKLFGKGVYVYNGYGTGSKIMQDYN